MFMNTTTQTTPKLRFATYNIDCAIREEKYEETKFVNRSEKFIETINAFDADIINLQELRELPNTPKPEEFLLSFKRYKFIIGKRNPSPLAFANAILYDPTKLFLVEYCNKWLSSTPDVPSDDWTKDGRGATVVCAKFYHVMNEKIVTNVKPFWVFNTHFLLEEDVKTKSCHALLSIVAKLIDSPFILSGDFNFFWDREGDVQREILTKAGMLDVGKFAKTHGGKSVKGTFIGFEHDEFKSKLYGEKNALLSRLDHIFLPGDDSVSCSNVLLYTKSHFYKNEKEDIEKELTHRNYPSDHLPIVTDLEFILN